MLPLFSRPSLQVSNRLLRLLNLPRQLFQLLRSFGESTAFSLVSRLLSPPLYLFKSVLGIPQLGFCPPEFCFSPLTLLQHLDSIFLSCIPADCCEQGFEGCKDHSDQEYHRS